MDLDIETAVLDSPSRFTRALAALVGVVAIVAGLLAFAENHASRQENRSLLLSARMAAEAAGRIPATQSHGSFGFRATQEAIIQQARGTARLIATSEAGVDDADYLVALAEGDTAAGERLAEIGQQMAAVPDADSGLDPFTLDVLSRGQQAAADLIEQQNAEVDRAEVYSQRGNRAVLALSILAVAAVLFGFAGAVRDTRPGVAALGTATVFLVVSAVIGFTAVLI